MGVTTGMRGKDLRSFLTVARQHNVIILVRHTNEDSLKYDSSRAFHFGPARHVQAGATAGGDVRLTLEMRPSALRCRA